MDFNDGTIFRVYVSAGQTSTVDAKVDIAQQELNGKVYIAVENFVLNPTCADPGFIPPADPVTDARANVWPAQNELQNYWANRSYLQLESFQLVPGAHVIGRSPDCFDDSVELVLIGHEVPPFGGEGEGPRRPPF